MKIRIMVVGLIIALLQIGGPRAAGAQDSTAAGARDQVPATPNASRLPVTTALTIGDAAPALAIDTWVKGAPVPHLKKGQTYVVEFWATWCGPCKQSIPHLTEVQKKFKDRNVTIIGISSEQKGLEVIRPFVDNLGDKMNYTVAFDKGQETYNAWMAAAGQNGIPTAFVVNGQGQVAWIGHPVYPQGELERILDEVSSGHYDLKAAAERAHALQDAQTKLTRAAAASDTAGVLNGLEDLMVLDKARSDEYAVKKLNILLFVIKDYDNGYKFASRLIEGNFKDNAQILNSMAWAIIDSTASPGLVRRDLDVALRAVARANELTAGKDPQILDTLARVHFEKGDLAKAAEFETTAVELNQDEKSRTEMQSRLDKYRASTAPEKK